MKPATKTGLLDLLDGILGHVWKSDFNDRERQRFAAAWRTIAQAANKVADGLLTKNDKDVMKGALVYMTQDDEIKEMMKIVFEQMGGKAPEGGAVLDMTEQMRQYAEGGKSSETAPETAPEEPPKVPIEMPPSSIPPEAPVDSDVGSASYGEGFPGQDKENSTLG